MAANLVLPVGMFPAAGVKAERLDGIMARGRQDCVDNRFELIAAVSRSAASWRPQSSQKEKLI